jgi:hypothetical protein
VAAMFMTRLRNKPCRAWRTEKRRKCIRWPTS